MITQFLKQYKMLPENATEQDESSFLNDVSSYFSKYLSEGLDSSSDICHTIAHSKGFTEASKGFAADVMLIVTELSEAVEADRRGTAPDEHVPQFSNRDIEIADTFIRLFDLCGRYGINIGDAIAAKMSYNITRPKLHGKKY